MKSEILQELEEIEKSVKLELVRLEQLKEFWDVETEKEKLERYKNRVEKIKNGNN